MKRVLLAFMIVLMTACSADEVETQRTVGNENTYTLVFQTQDVEDYVSVYAGSEITYAGGSEFVHNTHDYVNDVLVIETKENPTKIDTNFYIENGTPVSIRLYNYEGQVIDSRTIISYDYNYVFEF